MIPGRSIVGVVGTSPRLRRGSDDVEPYQAISAGVAILGVLVLLLRLAHAQGAQAQQIEQLRDELARLTLDVEVKCVHRDTYLIERAGEAEIDKLRAARDAAVDDTHRAQCEARFQRLEVAMHGPGRRPTGDAE